MFSYDYLASQDYVNFLRNPYSGFFFGVIIALITLFCMARKNAIKIRKTSHKLHNSNAEFCDRLAQYEMRLTNIESLTKEMTLSGKNDNLNQPTMNVPQATFM